MRKVITISGGKDSTACAIWALNTYKKKECVFVFCDTGWEAKETYTYLKYLEKELEINIKHIRSNKYKNFEDMVNKKKRFPSTQARFCTEELKVKPMVDWVLSQQEDLFIIQGIRRQESRKRANMNSLDDYFLYYHTSYGVTKKGKPKYHTYRRKEVLAREQVYATGVFRPIFNWTAQEVFDYMKTNGIAPNPLYQKGLSRVGCFPCVMCNQTEIRLIAQQFPQRIKQIETIEKREDATFFPPNYIPIRFASKSVSDRKGLIKKVPRVSDVVKYVIGNKNQITLFELPKNACRSIYNICE